jgi:endonuclease/exonuclease/phosphatase family metal-dependent hydrolase
MKMVLHLTLAALALCGAGQVLETPLNVRAEAQTLGGCYVAAVGQSVTVGSNVWTFGTDGAVFRDGVYMNANGQRFKVDGNRVFLDLWYDKSWWEWTADSYWNWRGEQPACESGSLAPVVVAPTTQSGTAGTETPVAHLTYSVHANGWGPVEQDRSNGEAYGGDGAPMRIGGQSYASGLGVHGRSEIDINLAGMGCTRFLADVGVDDEVGSNGSVVFYVQDGSGSDRASPVTKYGWQGATLMDADITGVQTLKLVVGDVGDGLAYDHANWANARVRCSSGDTAGTSPQGSDGTFKLVFWNMQNGSGIMANGGTCPFGTAYGDSGAGKSNAWNTGHLQAYLDVYVKNDPAVIAYAATEVNSASLTPALVAAHLGGWQRAGDHTGDGTSLFARHGFKGAPVEVRLSPCGPYGMHFVFGRVFRTAAAAAANSDDYVNVVSTHFMHADAGNCGSSDVQGAEVRAWLAAHANNGKPIVVLGDLNVIFEPAVDPKIWNFQPYGPGTTYWYKDSYYPAHRDAWATAGFVDAYRAVFPSYETHAGFTSTWHGGPYYGPLWKRIDYALVNGLVVRDFQLFNSTPETGNPKDCIVSDHAGLVVTLH